MSEKQQTKEEGGQLAIKVLQLWIKFAYKKLFFDNNLLVCRQAGRQEAQNSYLSVHSQNLHTTSWCSFNDIWPETRWYKNIKYLYCHATARENTAKNYS